VCLFEEPEGGGVLISIVVLLGKLLAACVIFYLLERFVLKKVFGAFARSLELLYLGSMGYATGLAAIAILAGFSGEITAFLAGVSIAQLPYKMHIETKMEPIKSLGVAIFFISLGLQLQVDQTMVDALPIGLALAIFTLIATLPLFMLLGYLAKLKAHNVFMLGLLMNQISEFSLILCTLCVRAGVLEPVVLTVMTLAAVVSIVFSSIGHVFIDDIYGKVQRWGCFRCIDDRHNRSFAPKNKLGGEEVKDVEEQVGLPVNTSDETTEHFEEPDQEEGHFRRHMVRAQSLQRHQPVDDDGEWAFEDQLKDRSTEQLQIDLKKTTEELDKTRKSMAATADEKRLHLENTKISQHGGGGVGDPSNAGRKSVKDAFQQTIVELSHATDITHGMIEGYVIIDHKLLFCTLRAGRMLFWREQQDVGHAPPMSMWDISGMAILNVENHGVPPKRPSSRRSSTILAASPSLEEKVHPWEWTIVLGHIHRHTGTSSIEDDAMKLTIHGLEDHSDHDAQDWQDALAVATAMLNPIALRLAHIREELHALRLPLPKNSAEIRKSAHSHRNEILCIGYNEMFPAVLALADAIHKDVVVVEYDPMKINTVKKLYNEEKRRQDYKDKKSGQNPMRASNGDLRSLETEAEAENDVVGPLDSEIKGVSCEYADIHDPECWEELEMDQAFMLICTMKGARHAEKAIMKWLRKHNSDAIFIACTNNNVEAIKMYQAGAHFVMQTDALAMRSTREIFMETVANVGDCSQLVNAGYAHKKRLVKLEKEDKLKFQYETGL